MNELVTLQSALVNVKMFLSGEGKLNQDKLVILVDEAYSVVMKKMIVWTNPFLLKFC